MTLLKTTLEFRANSEEEANSIMEQYKKEATEKGYTLGSAGYVYKSKKSGEEAWVVKIVQNFCGVWDE